MISYSRKSHIYTQCCILKYFILLLISLGYIYILYSEWHININFPKLKLFKKKLEFEHLRPYYYPVSCQHMFENDSTALQYAKNIFLNNRRNLSLIPDEYYNITKEQCEIYRSERFNETFHKQDTDINRAFPLAFTILLYNNIEQFERFLRIIYRPQNFYCIHIDRDSPSNIFKAAKSIIQCFDNVFIVSKREAIFYATFSRLQADFNCINDLLKYPSWKYLLNAANTELPLKTNGELVKILSIYRGFNDIEGNWKSKNIERTHYVWKMTEENKKKYAHANHLYNTNQLKTPLSNNITIVKGSAYGAFSRAFIEFVHTNSIAKQLANWSVDTYSPDEHYWATLNYNVHLNAPGGYKAKSDPTLWTARYVNWGTSTCYGQYVRGICVFGIYDLPNLLNRPELIANKFYLNMDPIAYQCLEELILNQSKLDVPLKNAAFYHQMPFLTLH